jgi:drug/metabolite transporter (DMT)-like permease
VTGYLLAIAAACCFGSATALQHRAARAVPYASVSALRLTVRLVRDPTWLVGRVADIAAVVLQALALRHGSLLGVQSIVSCGIVVAIALSAAMHRRVPHRRELVGAALLIVGVAMTSLLTRTGTKAGQQSLSRAFIFVAALVALGTLGGAVIRSSRNRRVLAQPTAMLGAAAGACFATGNAFLKIGSLAATTPIRSNLLVVALGMFALLGLVGNVLVQRGFQLGEISPGLSALVAAEPVTALAVGAFVLHDRIASGLHGGLGAIGLCLLVVGVYTASTGGRSTPLPTTMPISAPTAREVHRA